MPTLSAERLRELLVYGGETGEFRWRTSRVGCRAGDLAGSVNGRGYVQICLNRKLYLAHRLAWLYITGEWPANDVDHINGNTMDNRWNNLRPATRAQNNANSRRSAANTSGFKGVYRDESREKWAAQICQNSRRKFLGYFGTPQEAHSAYVAATVRLNGEYARVA